MQPWCDEEDAQLAALVDAQAAAAGGSLNAPRWAAIAKQLKGRRGKQCRDRYVNHLAPNISRGEWTDAEERALAEGYLVLGTKWAALARRLPGRTENMVRARAHATHAHVPIRSAARRGAVLPAARGAASAARQETPLSDTS